MKNKNIKHLAIDFFIYSTFILLLFVLVRVGYSQTIREPFGFNDKFYWQNGVDPNSLVMRENGNNTSIIDIPDDKSTFESVRILTTTGGYDAKGNIIFYVVPAKILDVSKVTLQAQHLAKESFVYIFPKKNGNPLSPASSNRRQDNIFDTDGIGYINGNNPLGLWSIKFVSYKTKEEKIEQVVNRFQPFFAISVNDPMITLFLNELLQQEMIKIEQIYSFLESEKLKFGSDLDGTPIIKSINQLTLYDQLGLLEIKERSVDGSDGFVWVI